MRSAIIFLLASSVLLPSIGFATEADFQSFKSSLGCTIEQVTEGPFGQYQFQGISRDGQWLSYNISETDAGPYHAVLINLQTGEFKKLLPRFNNTGNFSADASTLVAAVFGEDGKTDIVELNLESEQIHSISPDPAWDWLPSYSPDQTAIVFNSFRDGDSDLYLYDRTSGQLSQLTDDPRYDAHGEFSPDGQQLLFHRMISKRDDGRYDFDIVILDLGSGIESIFAQTPFEESYASWSPDARHIVFSSDFEEAAEKHNLYIGSLDGNQKLQLTSGNWKDSYAYWTRDGTHIYFNSDRSGTTQVHRMLMDGVNCR